MTDMAEERIARNDAVFREANEGIRRAAEEHGVRERVPFLCECADEQCAEIVRVSLVEYDAVRADPRRFLYARDHHVPFARSVELVEEREGYAVVEKVGVAAEIVEELDPRRDA